ncbi:MAG: peptide deformylase [Anaerolineaceae bacterium]|nr:peptide deformylase [Anaerolineaceae bacterium]
MILDIVQIGDPVLRRKAHKITQIDRDIRLLADDMVETLRDSGGVGLAAPQIGESLRMIVVEYPEDDSVEDSPMKTYKVINPEIIWRSEETVEGNEGCLSIPGYVGTVVRNESIKVKGLSVFGRPLKINASGWLARIFQHEIDHLEGICYIDRATAIYQPSEEDEGSAEEPEASGEAAGPAEGAQEAPAEENTEA